MSNQKPVSVDTFIKEWKGKKKGKAVSGDCPDSVALMVYNERKKNGTSFSGMEKLFNFLADHNGMVAYRLFHRGKKLAKKKG